jgi:CRP-like cAMP-binding protein
MDQRRGLSALRRVPILAGVSDAALERVARACKWQEFEAGEQLVQHQDPSTDVFFLTAGKLRVNTAVAPRAFNRFGHPASDASVETYAKGAIASAAFVAGVFAQGRIIGVVEVFEATCSKQLGDGRISPASEH